MKQNKDRPGKTAVFFSTVICFLLTGAILLLCGCTVITRMVYSDGMYRKIVSDERTLDPEMTRIFLKIDRLAEQYSFDPEPVKASISRDSILNLGDRAVTWWTSILRDGNVTTLPSYDLTAVEEILDNDGLFTDGLRNWELREKKSQVTKQIGKVISESVLPVRGLLINVGARKILNRIPVHKVLNICRHLILPLIAAILFLSGLLALTVSRKLNRSLTCIGGSLGAAGIVQLFLILLFLMLNVRGMIGEISDILSRQYVYVEGKVLLQVGLSALLMIIAGAAGMILGNRGRISEETA